jgi:outer membrane lipoprotein-sorting protein
MRYRKYLLVMSLFFFCGHVFAGTENSFEKFQQEAVKIKTLHADFVQKKFMKILSQPLVSEGRFDYVFPDALRWEYSKPLRSIVITYHNKTKRYVYAGGKMVEDQTGGVQAMQIVLSEVTGWMRGHFDQNPSLKASLSNSAKNTCIILTPVDEKMAAVIQKIEITLSSKKGTVKSVKIFEDPENFTQIDFRNVKTNEIISPSVFQDVQ